MSEEGGSVWQVSKTVSLAFIFGVLLQAGYFIWSLSKMQTNIEVNRSRIIEVRKDLTIVEVQSHNTDIQLGRIEENLKNMSRVLEKIEENLNDH